ncbi:hypothetical protein [Thalassovita sp.]|uniref:hypothetical protein n=1 Tax=Thalassovita sp. TaxID=1979401 RepID=UPI002B275C96|nr:hypothetical protein [Thalassovita sp.]
MALSYPLSASDFFAWLPISQITFHLPGAYEASETGDGEVITAQLGTRLWTGEVTLGRMSYDEIARAEVYLAALQQPGRAFMAFDRRRPVPLADPTGSAISGITAQISSLASNNRDLSLTNLPAGYRLGVGDYLSFSYGSSPTRTALHRIQTTQADADAGGETGLFEVVPHIRPGAVIGAGVTLVQPACKALIVPDSVEPGSNRSRINEGFKFRFRQTLR